MTRKGKKNLTYTQRLQLEAYLKAGLHKKEIACKLGVCLATVYNELKRGSYEYKRYSYTDWLGEKHYKPTFGYSPNIAQDKYKMNMTSCGAHLKLGSDFDFIHYVEKRVLVDKLSPHAVCGEIRRNKPCKTVVSKTTMYRYIEQGLFMNIRLRDLPMYKRKRQYRKAIAKRPPKGTSIEKRPVEILKRDKFGHWEMDCVVGKQSTRNVLLVLTERLTRYEIVMRMPDRKASTVVEYLNKLERKHGKRFRKLFKSITIDNGSEFADFVGLEKSVYGGRRTTVYYCHPYTSCERGTNERINRDIRRWIPKGADIAKYTDKQIKAVECWVNAYPREIFGFASAAERFAEEIATIV